MLSDKEAKRLEASWFCLSADGACLVLEDRKILFEENLMASTISDIYRRYDNTLRPLVSEIEGRNESFEEPLLNDVASMFDALALSESDMLGEERDKQLERASSYLDLSISHGYQYLIKNLDGKMKAFDRMCKSSDRELLDGGKFVGEYSKLKKEAKVKVREGRQKDDITALPDYQAAYDTYVKIEQMVDGKLPFQIMQHARRSSSMWTIMGWLVSILISVAVGKTVSEYSEEIICFISAWNNE